MPDPIRFVVIRAVGHMESGASDGATLRRYRDSGPGRASLPVPPDIRVDEDEAPLERLQSLEREPDVIGVAPTMPVSLIEPLSSRRNSGAHGSVAWGIEAVRAHETGLDAGNRAVVAVLDTGIETTHPAFSTVRLIPGDNLVDFTGEGNGDVNGHGTHVAATIFGRDVGGTRIGVARGVQKVLIGKVLGSKGGSTEAVYRSVAWAVSQGAHVISMSLGLDFVGLQERLVNLGYNPKQATSLALAGYRANVRLFDRFSDLLTLGDQAVGGSVVVAASGNESDRPSYAITVAPPATGDKFLSVGALGRVGKVAAYTVADFSNDEVKCAAPGVDVLSAALGGGLQTMSGTSMATPHVAGVAALWADRALEAGRFKASDVIETMKANAEPLERLSKRDVGWGMPLAPQPAQRRLRSR